MRGAPNFHQWPDPVDGMWKINLLRWLGQEMKIDILVETGSCEGVTPFNLKSDFRAIYTIELHDGLYEGARKWLEPYKNVRCYHGSSRTLLESILLNDAPEGPVIFWLDAHSSGPHTADDGNPLPDEVGIITRLRPDAIIVVDDMMNLDSFLGQMSDVDLAGWQVEYRTGEIVMHRIGRYKIPPFERIEI